MEGNSDIVEMLIDKGAEIDMPSQVCSYMSMMLYNFIDHDSLPLTYNFL